MNTVFDKARDLATALLESEAGKKVNDAMKKLRNSFLNIQTSEQHLKQVFRMVL